MSLINDALKRARDSQPKSPLPSGVAPLMPVEPRAGGFNWILAALVICPVIVACFFISLALAKRTVEKSAPVPVAATPAAPATEAPTPPPVETNPVEPVVAPPSPMPANPAPKVSIAASPIKLQGILYGGSQPSAIVAGKTVRVGDRVFDFRVKAITPDSVALTGPDGTNEVLRLGE